MRRITDGWRQPKRGLWRVEWVNFQSGVNELRLRALRSDVVWSVVKDLALCLLFVVLGRIWPYEWDSTFLLPLFGLSRQVIDIGTAPNDHTGDALRNWADKSNDNFEDLYALQSRTVQAGDVRFQGGATNEARIQMAIDQAAVELADRVNIPAFMLPYDASLVTFNSAIQMVREGGDYSVYDWQAYGADPTGIVSATLSAKASVDAAAAAGGGTSYAPAGMYKLVPYLNPNTAPFTQVAAGLILKSGVTLRGAGSTTTTLKLVDAAGPPAGMNATGQIHIISTDWPFSGGVLVQTQQDITIEDLTIDGNAANQTLNLTNYTHHGLFIGATRGAWHNRVRVKNVYGTSSGPPGETMHFEFNSSIDGHYADCEAVSDDALNTSTGFSANTSTGLSYAGCVARGMTHGMGFTHYLCALVRYVNCHAYQNGRHGFNSEISERVSYVNCQSGGRSALSAGGAFYTSGELLGNTDCGFKCMGSSFVSYVGCTGSYNSGRGLAVVSNVSPATNADTVIVDASFFDHNGAGGVEVETGSLRVFVTSSVKATGNTSFDFLLTAGTGTKYDVPTVFLSAFDFQPVLGSPAITALPTSGRRKVYAFDAAASECVQAWVQLPMGEATWSVQLFWCNMGAGAGDVNWQFNYMDFADNANISPNESLTASGALATAPTQELLDIIGTWTSGPVGLFGLIVSTGKLTGIRVQRNATAGNDTLANDAGFVGLLLTPVLT